MIVYIRNNRGFHYEIICSIIEKFKSFTNIKGNPQIYLTYFFKNHSFTEYIKQHYPNIKLEIPVSYDYCIDCTIYPKDRNRIINDGKHFYICHNIDHSIVSPYVYYLTPLCNTDKYVICDTLPFNNQKKTSTMPIYIIQGNITSRRRNFNLLQKILDCNTKYDYRIKVVGRGNLEERFLKYNKIILRNNLDFIDYHKEFIDAYCIIPLITKTSHRPYYKTKLTSSINYGLAYNLKFLADKPLQQIYSLTDCEIFNDENDIGDAFKRTLNAFYGQVVCASEDCSYLIHSKIKNNDGKHCCKVCLNCPGSHGPKCEKSEPDTGKCQS